MEEVAVSLIIFSLEDYCIFSGDPGGVGVRRGYRGVLRG